MSEVSLLGEGGGETEGERHMEDDVDTGDSGRDDINMEGVARRGGRVMLIWARASRVVKGVKEGDEAGVAEEGTRSCGCGGFEPVARASLASSWARRTSLALMMSSRSLIMSSRCCERSLKEQASWVALTSFCLRISL